MQSRLPSPFPPPSLANEPSPPESQIHQTKPHVATRKILSHGHRLPLTSSLLPPPSAEPATHTSSHAAPARPPQKSSPYPPPPAETGTKHSAAHSEPSPPEYLPGPAPPFRIHRLATVNPSRATPARYSGTAPRAIFPIPLPPPLRNADRTHRLHR